MSAFSGVMDLLPGAAAWWRHKESSGTVMVNERLSTDKDGVYTGGPTLGVASSLVDAAEESDTAITLTATSQYATVPDHPDMQSLIGGLSLGVFFRTTSTGRRYLWQRWGSSGTTQSYGLDLDGTNTVRVYIRTGGVNRILTADAGYSLRDGALHCVALDWDEFSGVLTAYVDGIAIGSMAAPGIAEVFESDLTLGRRPADGTTNAFLGTIEESWWSPGLSSDTYWNIWQTATDAPPYLSGLMAGAVTDSGFTLSGRTVPNASVSVLVDAGSEVFSSGSSEGLATADTDGWFKVDATGLSPDLVYAYAVEVDSNLVTDVTGYIRTLPDLSGTPTPADPVTVCVVHGTCMNSGSNHMVFDSMRDKDAHAFIQIGDFHYENDNGTSVPTRLSHYEDIANREKPGALLRSTSLAYVWDDHDFCGNNSIGTAAGKASAQAAYLKGIPHYPLEDAFATDGIYHSFWLAPRIAVIMTDLRSNRPSNSSTDGPGKTMMGATQKAWFKDTLLDLEANGAALILWASSSVYNGLGTSGIWYDNDQWSAYGTERTELADFIKLNDLESKVFVLTGDAHMLAYDDGSNSDFATGGGAPIRQFCGSALDQSSIIRGNNWSGGTYGGGGQYGYFEFTDDGTDIAWTWHGIKVNSTTGVDTVLINESGLVGPVDPDPDPGVGPYHDEILTRAGAGIAVTGNTIPLRVDLGALSPEWWQEVAVTHVANDVSGTVGAVAGSNSGTASNYTGATQDVYFRHKTTVTTITFYAVFADTYTLKVDGVTVDTVVVGAAGNATFDLPSMVFEKGTTHEFSITATITTNRQWRYVAGGYNNAGLGIVQIDWKEAAAYYLPWIWAATVDRGWDVANIEVLDGGVAVPYDLVNIDDVAMTGTLFVKCALTAGVDKVLTVRADPLVTGPAPTAPTGRHAVWAGFKVFSSHLAMNRVNDMWMSQFGYVGQVGTLFDFPGSGDGYLYIDGLSKPTDWTLGGSIIPDAVSGDRWALSAGTSGSTSNTYVECVGPKSSSWTVWNSTDNELIGPAAGAGVRKRVNATHQGTTERTLFLDGAEAVTDLTVAQRPGSTGDRFYIGAGVASSSNTVDGRIEFAYYRDGILSDAWLAVEYASWEHPETFWSITEVTPTQTITLDPAIEIDDAQPLNVAGGIFTFTLGVATETDSAQPLLPGTPPELQTIPLGVATETDTAQPFKQLFTTDTGNMIGGRSRGATGTAKWIPPLVLPPAGVTPPIVEEVAHAFSPVVMQGAMPLYTVTSQTKKKPMDRLLIGGKDVTFFRDVPTPFPGFGLVEPLMHGPTTISFPQIAAVFENPGEGDLYWCHEWAKVEIQRVDLDTGEVLETDYRGLVVGFDIDGSTLVLQVGGEAYGRAAMRERQVPIFFGRYDLGRMAYRGIRRLGLPFKPYLGPTTGIRVQAFGGTTELDHLQQIVSMSYKNSGERWTIMPKEDEPRVWEMRLKDRETVHGTVYCDDERTKVTLSRDLAEEPNRIYMTGVQPNGQRVRFGQYPGLKQSPVPPYPFNDKRSFGQGTTDAQTDTGDSISIMIARLRITKYMNADEAPGGYDADVTKAIKELQSDAGLTRTGNVNVKTWNAMYDFLATGFSLRWSAIQPAAERSMVQPWFKSGSGARMRRNPRYKGSIPKVDRNVDVGSGFWRKDMLNWARAELIEADTPNFVGTITFNMGGLISGYHTPGDPFPIERFMSARDLRPGMNLWLPQVCGGILVHVAAVTVSADGVVSVDVDTRARDAMEVWEIIERNRESRRSPYRSWMKDHRQSSETKDANGVWDEVGGILGARVPAPALTWVVFPIVAGQEGTIRSLRMDTNPNAEYVMAVFGKKISPSKLRRMIGNPLTKEGTARWENEAKQEELDKKNVLLYIAGTDKNPLGFWPKKKSKAGMMTGKWKDDAGFPYHTGANFGEDKSRQPIIWVAFFADRKTVIPDGRIMWNTIESGA